MIQNSGKDQNVESWLNQVSISKSGSKSTELSYRLALTRFLQSIGKTAEDILSEYETQPEKTFKRHYAQALNNFVMSEKNRGVASGSYASTLYAVKSFFKYNSLPLNFIASPSVIIENHNRDITKEEIAEVVKLSEYRDRAFFILMAQTGLRPDTLTKLRVNNIEKILEKETPAPCLITVPQESTKGKYGEYFTFCGDESIQALKEYFATRLNLTPESKVFVKVNSEEEVSAGDFSHFFRRIVMRLQKKHVLKVKTNRKEIAVTRHDGEEIRSFITRNDLRLYNLRKFFRKYAGQAGVDYVNFWMGHLSSMGVDLHYFSKDIEQHRGIYKEKAMPFLRIETRTPSETEKQIEQLSAENKTLRDELSNVQSRLEELTEENSKLLKGNEERMNYFNAKFERFESFMAQSQKEEKKKKKDDLGINY